MKKILSLLLITLMVFQMFAFVPEVKASGTADISVGTVEAPAGASDVQVPVILNSMGGSADLAALKIEISYPDELTLTSITRGDALPSLTITRKSAPYTSPVGILWDSTTGDTTTGTLVILNFSVSADTAEGKYEVAVRCAKDGAMDSQPAIVALTTENGGVIVTEPLAEFNESLFTFSNQTFVYDGNVHSLEVQIAEGAPEGTAVAYSLSGAKNAGTYNVTATITAPGYNAKQLTAVMTISKLPVVISMTDDVIDVGEPIPELEYLCEPTLLGNDTITGAPAAAATGAAGKYEITRRNIRNH